MNALQRIMAAHPTLTVFGFDAARAGRETHWVAAREELANSIADFEFCARWLADNLPPARHITRRNTVSSYALKHWAEPFTPRGYLFNGVMLAALLAAECYPSRYGDWRSGPNLFVGVARYTQTVNALMHGANEQVWARITSAPEIGTPHE